MTHLRQYHPGSPALLRPHDRRHFKLSASATRTARGADDGRPATMSSVSDIETRRETNMDRNNNETAYNVDDDEDLDDAMSV